MKSQDYIAVTHRGRYRRGKAEGGTIADECDGGSLCSSSFSGVMMDPETVPASSLTLWPTCCMSRVTWSKYVIKMCPRRRVYKGARGLSRAVKNCQSTASRNSPCCPGAASVSTGLTAQERRLLWQLRKTRGVGGWGGMGWWGVSIKWSQCVLLQWMGWVDVCISGHRADAVMWILKRHFRRRHGLAVETGTYLLSGA